MVRETSFSGRDTLGSKTKFLCIVKFPAASTPATSLGSGPLPPRRHSRPDTPSWRPVSHAALIAPDNGGRVDQGLSLGRLTGQAGPALPFRIGNRSTCFAASTLIVKRLPGLPPVCVWSHRRKLFEATWLALARLPSEVLVTRRRASGGYFGHSDTQPVVRWHIPWIWNLVRHLTPLPGGQTLIFSMRLAIQEATPRPTYTNTKMARIPTQIGPRALRCGGYGG